MRSGLSGRVPVRSLPGREVGGSDVSGQSSEASAENKLTCLFDLILQKIIIIRLKIYWFGIGTDLLTEDLTKIHLFLIATGASWKHSESYLSKFSRRRKILASVTSFIAALSEKKIY